MLYRMLLKLKKDMQSITNLEVAHRYLCSLEGTSTFQAEVLQQIFVECGDMFILLDVYNIFEKLKPAHAHYEASIVRPPSHSRPQLPPITLIRSSHFSSKAKVVHSTAPILPSCNYYGNPAHKASECNISSEEFFCDYCGKEGHQEAICFAKFSERKNSDYHDKIC